MTAYFAFNPQCDDPLDALENASSVIEMLRAFVNSPNPFECFEGNNEGPLMGLGIVLASTTNAINTASAELRGLLKTADYYPAAPMEAFSTPTAQGAWRAGFKTARENPDMGLGDDTEPAANPETLPPSVEGLSAREVAVLETFRKGYALDDIAQAVNLKKASVQRIIARLKATGDIPPSEISDRAVSA